MSKHTAGPWRVANGVQIRSQRDQIAKVWMMRSGEGNANARLIAASPDLLEALQAFVKYAEDCNDDSHELDKARAAIAKARGTE